jgi:hypothetical protein
VTIFTFEMDGALVALPRNPPVLFDPEQARKSIEKDRNLRRSYLYPLLDESSQLAISW